MGKTYAHAGVDIEAGDEFVRRIRSKVRTTFSSSVLADIGAFGAFYEGKFAGINEPVLVSSVDGVGTKLKVAFLTGRHDTVGQDLVNHCVNDIAVCGAEPMFFLDYFATGKLNPLTAEAVIDGMVAGCRENGCSLVGGETAEMPDFYRENEYDIAGMIVGVVDKKRILDGSRVRKGDVLVGLPSTGLHTNGYSLARKVLFERYDVEDFLDELGMRLGEALLTVHRSYLKPVRAAAAQQEVHGIAHITGGGIVGNVSRLLRPGHGLKIDWRLWERPPVFKLIQKMGNVPEDDMRRTFNLGIGLVLLVSAQGSGKILSLLTGQGEKPQIIGEVTAS